MEAIKGVIFDIDGVIVDSEPLHAEVLKETISDLDIDLSTQNLSDYIGFSLDETIARLYPGHACKSDLIELYENTYTERISASYLRTGIKQAIQRLIEDDIVIGFVSSASRRVCESNLRCLGLSAHLPLVSSDDVPATKPDPAPYNKMLSILDLKAGEVIVIEDSDTGMTSANSASIEHILGWPHGMSSAQTFHHASKNINTIEDMFIYLSGAS